MTELKRQFRTVLVGFEKYSFTDEDIRLSHADFEAALFDINACQKCDGKLCRTFYNYKCSDYKKHKILKLDKCSDKCYSERFRGYLALCHDGCEAYKKPTFRVFYCPGILRRKEKIMKAMTSFRIGEKL